MSKLLQKVFVFALLFSFAVLPEIIKPVFAQTKQTAQTFYNVKTYGAKGDGKALDTNAINKAIDAAAAVGGGTVFFPAGTYLSFSIHLKSNITLYLDAGATNHVIANKNIFGRAIYPEAVKITARL